jgi:Fe-S cluster biogenesis protein NfuA/nitrite reductase/ring-hydroxylating ferredoxin subunit
VHSSQDQDARRRAGRVEALVGEIGAFPEPFRGKATELIRTLLELYGDALATVMEVAQRDAPAIVPRLAGDDLLGHLLILHGLHPLDTEARVREALESVRPYLRSHGGDVEFVRIANGVAEVRLQGSCHGCPSSLATLRLAIEDAVQKAAPELDGVTAAEGAAAGAPVPAAEAVPLWVRIDVAVAPEALVFAEAGGVPLVLTRLGTSVYAYRNACAGCGAPFAGAEVQEGSIVCARCGAAYDIRLAGRPRPTGAAGPSSPARGLDPVPLLERDGVVKVAVAGAETLGGSAGAPAPAAPTAVGAP